MLKKLLYLITIIMIPRLLCLEAFIYWSQFPPEIRKEVMKNLFELKDKSTESLIESYKKFLNLPKTIDKKYLNELSEAYKQFIINNLSDRDFKNLNQKLLVYIVESNTHLKNSEKYKPHFETIYLLIQLLSELGKFDPNFKDEKLGWTALQLTTDQKLRNLLIQKGAKVPEKIKKK